jgi:hypothetical protein
MCASHYFNATSNCFTHREGYSTRSVCVSLCLLAGIMGLLSTTRWPIDDTNGFRLPLSETTVIKRWCEHNSKSQYEQSAQNMFGAPMWNEDTWGTTCINAAASLCMKLVPLMGYTVCRGSPPIYVHVYCAHQSIFILNYSFMACVLMAPWMSNKQLVGKLYA